MKKLQSLLTLTMLLALGAILSSCGNGGVPTVASSSSSTTVAGKVTDAPAVGATVRLYSMKTGNQVGSDATTGADGSFSIGDADFGQFDADDVFYTVATGGKVNDTDADFLKFKSILGSKSEMDTAGSDGTINTTDIPDLAVSNVTSAKVALVEKKRNITVDAGQDLSSAVANIAADEKEQEKENMALVLKVAGAMKAIVDNPDTANATYGLTLDEDNDLMDYIATTISVTNDVADVTLPGTLETAGLALEDDILGDADLAGGLSGEAGEDVTAASLAGTWYGYRVDTWGDSEDMQGPELMDLTIATSGGSCTADQLYVSFTEDQQTVGRAAAISAQVTACATLSGNILKFQFTPSDAQSNEVIEVIGTINGSLMDGTYSVKASATSPAEAGGIFKIGLSDSTASYDGTYTFKGSHTVLYVNTTATANCTDCESVGSDGTLIGSFTISGTSLTGSITESNSGGNTDSMQGELKGPRVTARISNTVDNESNTIFVVFLLSDSEVTGLYMEMQGQLTEPTGDAITGGKIKFSTVTKS